MARIREDRAKEQARLLGTEWGRTMVTVTRKQMLAVRELAEKRMLPTSLFWGERIIGYRESKGGDHHWHAQVVLANGTRVFLDEVVRGSSTPASTSSASSSWTR